MVGRNPHARTQTSRIEELICSQEGWSGQHLSTFEIANKLDISAERSPSNAALFTVFVQTFSNAHKSLGGMSAVRIILRQCSTVKCCWHLHVGTWWVNNYKISHWNSLPLLRKLPTNLGVTFLCHTLYIWLLCTSVESVLTLLLSVDAGCSWEQQLYIDTLQASIDIWSIKSSIIIHVYSSKCAHTSNVKSAAVSLI